MAGFNGRRIPRNAAGKAASRLPLVGPWPEGPWWLLGAAAVAAPFAVLGQGADAHVAAAAALACLASPPAAIEAVLGIARLTLRVDSSLSLPPR
jgi:uncharacterized membrane protein